MTIEEAKQNLGRKLCVGGHFYEIAGFAESPVIILRLWCQNPWASTSARSMIVDLPERFALQENEEPKP